MQNDPFHNLKNIPYIDDDILEGFTGMNWADPSEVLRSLKSRGQWPPLNVIETTNEVIVILAIPGLQQSRDVKVELQGNTLTLEGEINYNSYVSSPVKTHQEEIRQGKFNRSIILPMSINNKSARATYRNGILEIRISKIYGNQIETLTINIS